MSQPRCGPPCSHPPSVTRTGQQDRLGQSPFARRWPWPCAGIAGKSLSLILPQTSKQWSFQHFYKVLGHGSLSFRPVCKILARPPLTNHFRLRPTSTAAVEPPENHQKPPTAASPTLDVEWFSRSSTLPSSSLLGMTQVGGLAPEVNLFSIRSRNSPVDN